MKKDLLTHFGFLLGFFALITLFKGRFELAFIPFWIGGIIGTLLPDVDHLLYVYFCRPQETTSQKVTTLIADNKYKESWDMIMSQLSLYLLSAIRVVTFFDVVSCGRQK